MFAFSASDFCAMHYMVMHIPVFYFIKISAAFLDDAFEIAFGSVLFNSNHIVVKFVHRT